MDGGNNLMKKFVSQSELADVKKKRQEEWEKTRQPDQPMIRPEEPVDHRSLFERLQQQKKEKEAKYEEEYRLSNQIQRLDEDDVQFLSLVSQQHTEIMKQNEMEEQQLVKELEEHRTRQAAQSSNKPKFNLPSVKIVPGSAKRKKSLEDESDQKKAKMSDSSASLSALTNQRDMPADKSTNSAAASSMPAPSKALSDVLKTKAKDESGPENLGTACGQKVGKIEVLGYLPGIGSYLGGGNSSSSDSDSDDEGSLMKCFTKKNFEQKQMIKIMRKGSCS